MEPTLRRTVRGRPARVPFGVYPAFLDSPEVIAAAARFRGIGEYRAQALGDGRYRASDGGGARGVYQVLVREPGRRVMLSWGEHSGSLLGTIRGMALSVLVFEPRGPEVEQRLTAYVHIDHPVAAVLARILVVIFGDIADRRLARTFEVTAAITEWAVEEPAAFCAWLRAESLSSEARGPVSRAMGCP